MPDLLSHSGDAGDLSRAIAAALDADQSALRVRCRQYLLDRLSWRSTIRQWEAELEQLARQTDSR